MAKFTWFCCFPTNHPDNDPEADFHPDMLVGLVPSPAENAAMEAEHQARLDAEFPQLYCDVCREEDELLSNGATLMCSGCLAAVGVDPADASDSPHTTSVF